MDPSGPPQLPADVAPASGFLSLTAPGDCALCRPDCGAIPAEARFCPRCGRSLAHRRDPDDLWLTVRGLLGTFFGNRPVAMPGFNLPAPTTASLAAYANALVALGTLYEQRPGWRRNREEAVRCYLKAAKVGHRSALSRLANFLAGQRFERDGGAVTPCGQEQSSA